MRQLFLPPVSSGLLFFAAFVHPFTFLRLSLLNLLFYRAGPPNSLGVSPFPRFVFRYLVWHWPPTAPMRPEAFLFRPPLASLLAIQLIFFLTFLFFFPPSNSSDLTLPRPLSIGLPFFAQSSRLFLRPQADKCDLLPPEKIVPNWLPPPFYVRLYLWPPFIPFLLSFLFGLSFSAFSLQRQHCRPFLLLFLSFVFHPL